MASTITERETRIRELEQELRCTGVDTRADLERKLVLWREYRAVHLARYGGQPTGASAEIRELEALLA